MNFPLEIVIRSIGLSGLADVAATEYPVGIEIAINAVARHRSMPFFTPQKMPRRICAAN